jgi:hypothetical protein
VVFSFPVLCVELSAFMIALNLPWLGVTRPGSTAVAISPEVVYLTSKLSTPPFLLRRILTILPLLPKLLVLYYKK